MQNIYYKTSEGDIIDLIDFYDSYEKYINNFQDGVTINVRNDNILVIDDIVYQEPLLDSSEIRVVANHPGDLYRSTLGGVILQKPVVINVANETEVIIYGNNAIKEGVTLKYSLVNASKYKMLSDTELLDTTWEYKTVGTNFPKISALTKPIVSPAFKVKVAGVTEDEMLENLEKLVSAFDRDCILGKQGRLYIGDYYRECFILSNTKGKVFKKNNTIVEFTAVSDDAFWKNKVTYEFYGKTQQQPQIATNLTPSASYRPSEIVYNANNDGTVNVEYEAGPPVSSPYFQWFMLDFGSNMEVASISGLTLGHTATPLNAVVEYSTGATTTSGSSITTLINTYSNQISTQNATTIKITSVTSPSTYTDRSLKISGHSPTLPGGFEVFEISPNAVPYNISKYEYISFLPEGAQHDISITIGYELTNLTWTTAQTIAQTSSNVTINEIENVSLRYLRIRSGNETPRYMGTVQADNFSVLLPEEEVNTDIIATNQETALVNCTFTNPSPEGLRTISNVWTSPTVASDGQGIIYFPNIKNVKIKGGEIQYRSRDPYADNGELWLEVLGSKDSYWGEDKWTKFRNLSQNTTFGGGEPPYRIFWKQVRLCLIPTDVHTVAHAVIKKLSIFVEFEHRLENESYAPSEAIIEITGPTNSPAVIIGDKSYGVNRELASGHILKIDTKEKEVFDYTNETNFENVFANRTEEAFDKIESGVHDVEWAGSTNGIKVTLEQARSEPKWK